MIEYVIQYKSRGRWADLIAWLTPRTDEEVAAYPSDERYKLWPLVQMRQVRRDTINGVVVSEIEV